MRLLTTVLILTILNSCNVGQKTDSREERFKNALSNLRQIGLFAEYKNLDDDQLTKTLIEKARKKYNVDGFDSFNEVFDLKNNSDFFDLHVAELDETRVWWRDLEADILDGNNVYAETVKEFGKLSGGFLQPEQIKEEWISTNGPVKVSFQDMDTLRVMNLKYEDDWYDTDFFKHLEMFMKSNGSPYSFYLHDRTGQDVFVIRLTEDEKEKIEKKMNWNLVKF
jgi:hypothetical protein